MPKIDALLDAVVDKEGSDLHVGAGRPPLARVRGDLVPLASVDLAAKDVEELLLEPLGERQRTHLQAELGLDFAFTHRDAVRFRARYYFEQRGVAAVFRVVPVRAPSLADIGAPEPLLRLAAARAGLVVVAGGRGAGATTTAAALVRHVNETRACHVVTIEEPVEIVHAPIRAQITQREVGVHASSFAAALKSAARDDADVVLVSSLEDAPALRAALALASSGVLVVATVHASSAAGALERLVGVAPEPERGEICDALAGVLAGVVAQRVVRTVDGRGRVTVFEVLAGGGAAADAIRRGAFGEIVQAMRSGGMATADAALERLLLAGRIGPEAALDQASDREAFAKVVARVRPDLDLT